jgi:rhamnose utilization protein RhaD (predicted bifunctional aldolase and dehydrogenase)
MPGFILAHTIYEMSKDLDWKKCEGIILHNHGIFTFDDDPKRSYDKMIEAVSKAEKFLDENAPLSIPSRESSFFDIGALETIMRLEKQGELAMVVNQSQVALSFASLSSENLQRGVLTPEHIIRTKRHPLIIKQGENIAKKLELYKYEYTKYFEQFASDEVMLNPSPNYAVIEGFGVVSFGKNEKEANIINDIIEHTMKAVLRADKLGGYQSISLKDSFDMEYWELEQAKLKK